MPIQSCNAGFDHPNVVKYDGVQIAEVDSALRAAFTRKPGEHWRDYLSTVG